MPKTSTPKAPLPSLSTRLRDLVDDNRLVSKSDPENPGPLSLTLVPGDPDCGVFIMVGDNASGKSLMVRLLASRLNTDKVEPLQVSMRYRTSSGMHRVFMFGSDEDESTGAVSLHAVKGGMRTCQERMEPTWLMLDEPDIGLAEGYCLALGEYLARFGNDLDGNGQKALGLVTHSKPLVQGLAKHLRRRPHFLVTGPRHAGMGLEQWLADNTPLGLDELLQLNDKGHQTWRAVEALLKS